MIRHRKHVAAFATVGCLLLAAGCRSDGNSASTTTAATSTSGAATTTPSSDSTDTTDAVDTTTAETDGVDTTTAETDPPAEAWTLDVSNCADPDAVTAPIEGEIKIGSAQPLSGTPAVAFAPVKIGMELYFKYASENGLIPGDHTVSIDIRDDQYDPTQTPNAVSSLLDEGVNMFSGIIGSPNNLAVRDTLNEECYPQLLALTGSPDWGDIENYPWLTGALVPYDIESKIYVDTMVDLGVKTVALFSVNNEFGKVYSEAFIEAAEAAGLEIVDEQTIEPAETTPPANQTNSISGKSPDAVMAIPLGAQCPTFLKEVVNAKAVNTSWDPKVFLTNTCSSRLLISLLAGGAGDGVYTSGNLIDPSDPKNEANEGVVTFRAAFDAAGLDPAATDLGTTATGWSVGEYTVNILIKAAESGTISRQSIIEAARNLQFIPTLARDGAQYKMDGAADPYSVQSLQVIQWNEASQNWTDIGSMVTTYES